MNIWRSESEYTISYIDRHIDIFAGDNFCLFATIYHSIDHICPLRPDRYKYLFNNSNKKRKEKNTIIWTQIPLDSCSKINN